ncbi:MAG: hypothetical protein HFJ72_03030, partial [Adlercreutzia sp.]|nr:hypothetical protein [Adlercreutzia sp.]
MNDTTKKIAGTAGSLLLLGSMGAGAVTAFAEEAPEAAPAGDELSLSEGVQRASAEAVQGDFSYTQTL